ncbi:MAG: helix-turn-helix domain-containing protein [Blastocatellia bacterium]
MYIHLYRLSHGFGKDQCLVSLDKLAERTGFSKRTVQTVLQNLENKSLITKLKHSFGKGIIQGTIFRVATITSLAEFASPAKNASLANSATIKDHHDDLKKHDHHPHQLPNVTDHQKQVMMTYQEITGNNWTKVDTNNYQKIKNVPIEKIEIALRLAYDRATNRPNSFAFFIKEIIASVNPKTQSRSNRKKAMAKIVERVRNASVGSNISPSEFVHKVKETCLREDVAFDNDLLDEILSKT